MHASSGRVPHSFKTPQCIYRLHMYIYICICVYNIYTYIFIHTNKYKYKNININTNINININISISININTNLNVNLNLKKLNIKLNININIYIYIYTYNRVLDRLARSGRIAKAPVPVQLPMVEKGTPRRARGPLNAAPKWYKADRSQDVSFGSAAYNAVS